MLLGDIVFFCALAFYRKKGGGQLISLFRLVSHHDDNFFFFSVCRVSHDPTIKKKKNGFPLKNETEKKSQHVMITHTVTWMCDDIMRCLAILV